MNRPCFSRGLVSSVVVGLVLVSHALSSAAPPALQERFDQAKHALRMREFTEAVQLFGGLAKDELESPAQAYYLQAVACFHDDKMSACRSACDQVIEAYPASDWYRKAIFLKAAALVAEKDWSAAEAIYESEAHRLLSQARKDEIAGVIVAFADDLCVEPGPNELDRPRPNYGKAYHLYGKALQMEIGRDLQDEVMFKRAVAVMKAGNPGQAIQDLKSYLQAFDPQWHGMVGEPRRGDADGLRRRIAPGIHILAARYKLVESLLLTGSRHQCRWEAEELLAILKASDDEEAAGLTVDTRWLVVRSHNLPQPSENFEGALDAAREFLRHHPSDSRGIKAAYLIAKAYYSRGRPDEAIAAYQAFIDGRDYQLPTGAAALADSDELGGKSPAEIREDWSREALFQIGFLQFGQKRFLEAIATWNSYVTRYPNGPHWSRCQSSIIDAKFHIGIEAVADEDYSRAREVFDAFLREHPLDQRSPQILFIFGQMHYVRAEKWAEAGDEGAARTDLEAAIDEWRRLVGKYGSSEPASAAQYRIGLIQEEKFADLAAALETYRMLNWGSYSALARQRVAAMTGKSLAIRSERTFRTNEPAQILMDIRNIDKVTVRIYRLNLDAYFRKTHELGGVETLDVTLIEPDEMFEVEIEDYEKYRPFEQAIEIPFADEQPGACVVNVSEADWEATTLVVRSNLDMILKSSRREALVFIQDVLNNDPAADVEVLLSDGEAVFATGKTGRDGVFRAGYEELSDSSTLRVLARRDGHFAACNLGLDGLAKSTGLAPKGYIYTDRPAYRPGEDVAFRGILRSVENQGYAVPLNRLFTVRVTDAAGRLLVEDHTALSRFGTFDMRLALPDAAPLGDYAITARSEVQGKDTLEFTGSFKVAEFKLEKIRLDLEFPQRVYFRGETVEADVKATYYWGEPLGGREIQYRLPDGRMFTGTTDAAGTLSLAFDTSAMAPGRPLLFFAEIPGENVQVQDSVFLALLGFSIDAETSQDVVLQGEPIELSFVTRGADGEPVGQDLVVTVLRREPSQSNPVLDNVPWVNHGRTAVLETTLAEHRVTTDPETGRATLRLTTEAAGAHIVRVSGQDRFGQTVMAQTGFQVSGEDDAVKLRLFADSAKLQVGGEAALRLHSRLKPTLALITHEGEEVIDYSVVRLGHGFTPLEFEVGHELFPNFRVAVAAIAERKVHQTFKEFTVERKLNVAVKPLNDHYAPGAKGRVELAVTDQLGRPVEAELSLALVNQALFAVHPDRTPGIVDFFQKDARRHAEFRVDSNAGFQYVGITRAVLKEVLAEGERLERRVEEIRRRERAAQQAGQVLFDAPAPSEPPTRVASEELSGLHGLGRDMMQGPGDVEDSEGLEGDLKLENIQYFGRMGGRRADSSESLAATPTRRETRGEGRWLPGVTTGPDGKAVVTIDMPETTTEWRLTARGCTPETLVGENTATTLTKKDFFVELKTPSFVRQGDGIRVLGRIHNLTEYQGPVKLLLTVTGRDVESVEITRFEKTVMVRGKTGILPVQNDQIAGATGTSPVVAGADRGGPVVAGADRGGPDVQSVSNAEIVFPEVRIPKFAEIELRLAAMAGDDLSDAVEVAMPVQPWGMEYAAHIGGVASVDSGVMLRLPDHKYSQRWLTVSVGRGAESAVIDLALDGALRRCDFMYPSGSRWSPSAGSDLLAAVNGMEYVARTLNREHDAYRRLRNQAVAQVGALVVSQLDDGGWAMETAANNPDWAASARAYWALVEARRVGIMVNQATISKGKNYLDNAFRSFAASDNDGKAMVLHALSSSRDADFANCNRLYRERNSLSPAALAYMAATFVNQNRGEARDMLDVLLSKAQTTTEDGQFLVHWASGTESRHAWMQDDVETTAMALIAMSQLAPRDDKTVGAANWLLRHRGGYGFSVGKSRGPVVAGLAHHFIENSAASADMRVTVLVNGKEIETLDLEGETALETRVISVAESDLRPVNNLIEFRKNGAGRFAYGATLRGFSEEITDPMSWSYPTVYGREYYHEQLTYAGRPINVQSTSRVANLEAGRRTEVRVNVSGHCHSGYLVMEEPIPAGTRVVEGSPTGNFDHYEIQESKIVFHYRQNPCVNNVRYELVGYVPGSFRVLPSVLRDPVNPSRMRVGRMNELTVLAPGDETPDPYSMNYGELFTLGRLNFEDGKYREALGYLDELNRKQPTYSERDQARMLLWIYTAEGFFNADRIVQMFEVLRERYPELEIPFDRILTVGRAYRELKEYERAWLVFRATIDASFISDSNVSALLQDEGRFLASIDYQERLWREYPETADTVAAYFALTQALYQKAPNAHELPEENGVRPEKFEMLARTAKMLSAFLTLYPNDPLADDAAFSLANSFLDLRDFDTVVQLGRRYVELYQDSDLASSFQYMIALGHFWQNMYDKALAAARVVAEGVSKDREFAQYIVGQIHHAQGEPTKAIEWYSKVVDQYPDAREAIEYFEERRIALDEVSVFRPGEDVAFELTYRNIADVSLLVYRVDLMTLYLREKNLSTITKVHLAGIAPEIELELSLGDGKDYVEKTREIRLDIDRDGAYLVICRGDDLFTSGLVLVTPLQLEVQENTTSGRVRVNVLDAVQGGYRRDVHVKAVGSASDQVRSGDTDLRGIFVADDIRGKTTVIARDGESKYAFYRGEQWLGAPVDRPASHPGQSEVNRDNKMDFQQNLRDRNSMIQIQNFEQFDKLRRQQQKGVEVQKAF